MESRIDAGLAQLREDIAKRDTETARRETRLVLAMIGIVGAAVAILKFL